MIGDTEEREMEEMEEDLMECPFCGAKDEWWHFECPDFIGEAADECEAGWVGGFQILDDIHSKMRRIHDLDEEWDLDEDFSDLPRWCGFNYESYLTCALHDQDHPLILWFSWCNENSILSGITSIFFVEKAKQAELLAELREVDRRLDEIAARYAVEEAVGGVESALMDTDVGRALLSGEIRWTRLDFVRPRISPSGMVSVELWDPRLASWRDPINSDEASIADWVAGSAPNPSRLAAEGLGLDGSAVPAIDPFTGRPFEERES